MSRFDLTPLFRTSVGFDRVSRLMDAAMELERDTVRYPPYNIVKTGDHDYAITLAMAGFSEDDIDLMLENRVLTVKAQQAQSDDEDVTYLHRGIAARAFERRFTLAEHIRVVNARLDRGLLHIELRQEVPEALKPRRIEVSSGPRDVLAAK